MICIIPGSYNPVTRGHLDVIQRCAAMFDKVVVLVADNPDKKCVSPDLRKALLEKSVSNLRNVAVVVRHGLTVDACKEFGADVIVKGVRNSSDFEYEAEMAYYNRRLGNIETLYLASCEQYSRISSSYVRLLVSFGEDISEYVPDGIAEDVIRIYGEKK